MYIGFYVSFKLASTIVQEELLHYLDVGVRVGGRGSSGVSKILKFYP